MSNSIRMLRVKTNSEKRYNYKVGEKKKYFVAAVVQSK